MAAALYDGYYLNLERSPDRRAKMEAQFAKFGLAENYRRYAAVEGANLPPNSASSLSPGERGAFRSHAEVITQAATSGRPIHVLEDDVLLSPYTRPAIDLAIRSGALDKTDILFTETLVPFDLRVLKQFKSIYDAVVAGGELDLGKLQIIDLASFKFAGATSYVVNPKSVPKLLEIYNGEWDRGPGLPIDILMRQEVHAGRLRADCAFPFVTAIDLASIANSTAGRERATKLTTETVLALMRYSFFVGRNLEWAHRQFTEAFAEKRPDRHRVLLEKALGFVLTDNFREF